MGAEVIRTEWHDDRAIDLLRGVRPYAPGGKYRERKSQWPLQ